MRVLTRELLQILTDVQGSGFARYPASLCREVFAEYGQRGDRGDQNDRSDVCACICM